MDCAAPCCTILPLHDFTIQQYADLDYALYLLNFDRLELLWLEGTSWRVHYHASCTNLDASSSRCMVHGTANQPDVCKRFNPYNCSYKRIFSETKAPESTAVRVDRGRMLAIAEHMVFDGHRNLVVMPDCAALEPTLPPLTGPRLAPVPAATSANAASQSGTSRTFSQFADPCNGCQPYCCTHISFPHAPPRSVANVDHLRFCLGFPGVEVGVDSLGQWTVVVRSRCRHVMDSAASGHCGVMGQPSRPQVCTLYDGNMCGFRYQFGQASPPGFVRLTAENFPAWSSLFRFDAHGYVQHCPSLHELKQVVPNAATAPSR